MKKRIWAIALFVILLTGVAFPGAAQTTQPAAAQIAAAERLPALERPEVMAEPARPNTSNVKEQMVVRGRVVDASEAPQAGLRVEALLPGDVLAASTRSETGGRFAIASLQPGEYRLRVLDAGGRVLPLTSAATARVTEQETQRPFYHELVLQGGAAPAKDSQEHLPVTPPTGESKTPTQAPAVAPDGLQATGQITGLVTAEATGLPVAYVSVYAYDENEGYLASGYTDSDGLYALIGLDTGNAFVLFQVYGQNYLNEWYDNKPDFESANPVAVVDGETTPDINAALGVGGQISGTVTAADTHLPLASVAVTVYDQNGDYLNSAYADISGNYLVSGLPTGDYKVRFNQLWSDYIGEYYDDKPDIDNADLVHVIQGNVTSDIDAELARGGKITGQVTAQGSGVPIEDVNVTLYASNNDYWDSTVTDASGVYTFTGLMTGGYKVRFVPSNSGPYADYIPEYYDDKPDLDTADVVNVTAPDTTSGIDAVLARGGKITGQVTAADTHLALENVDVDVYNSAGDWINDASTDASGLYTVTQLASGSYYLRFYPSITDQDYVPEYYNDKPDLESADPVAVVAPNIVSGINASLQRGGSITGRVTGEDSGQGLPDVAVEAINCYGWDVRSTTTDASGYYTITGLVSAGYSVGFFPWDYGDSRAYLDEYYNNKATWQGSNSVMVEAGETTTGINAALAKGAQISGRVTAADGGAPLDEVVIEIYNLDGWYMGDTTTDATGVYTTPGFANGDYYLWFGTYEWSASKDYVPEYYNNRPSYDDADPLALTPPHLLTGIDAVLERGGRISGRVTAEGSGVGLYDVYAEAYVPVTGEWDYAFVDNNGYYTIHGVPSGSLEVDFYPFGDNAQYVWEYYNNKTPKQIPDPVVVSAPGEVSGIDASLALGGAIECSVKAEDTNEPLFDVYVAAYDSQGDWIASDWTDADGQCTLNGLPSGEYRVWFETTIAYTYEACLINQVQYVEEYYNDKPDLDSANPISVAAPNVVTGIEALLAVGAPLPPLGRGNVFLPMVVKEP